MAIFRPHPPSSFADVIYGWNLVTNLISSTTFVRSSLEMGTSHVITEFAVRTKMSITIFAIIGRVHHLGVVLPTKLKHNLGLRSFNKINKIVHSNNINRAWRIYFSITNQISKVFILMNYKNYREIMRICFQNGRILFSLFLIFISIHIYFSFLEWKKAL